MLEICHYSKSFALSIDLDVTLRGILRPFPNVSRVILQKIKNKMKKEYSKPCARVTEVEFEQNLLAGSLRNSSHEGFTQSNDPLPIIEDDDDDSPF